MRRCARRRDRRDFATNGSFARRTCNSDGGTSINLLCTISLRWRSYFEARSPFTTFHRCRCCERCERGQRKLRMFCKMKTTYLTSTNLYLAFELCMSTTVRLTSSRGRFSIQDLMSCLAARASISLMSLGDPMADPPRWMLPMMRAKVGIWGRGFSGAPTTAKRSAKSAGCSDREEYAKHETYRSSVLQA